MEEIIGIDPEYRKLSPEEYQKIIDAEMQKTTALIEDGKYIAFIPINNDIQNDLDEADIAKNNNEFEKEEDFTEVQENEKSTKKKSVTAKDQKNKTKEHFLNEAKKMVKQFPEES